MAKSKKAEADEQEVAADPGIQPGHSIRGGAPQYRVYKAGDEEALAEEMTKDQAERLEKKGAIHKVSGKAKPAKTDASE